MDVLLVLNGIKVCQGLMGSKRKSSTFYQKTDVDRFLPYNGLN